MLRVLNESSFLHISQLGLDFYEEALADTVYCSKTIFNSSANKHLPPVLSFDFRSAHDGAGGRNRSLVRCVEVCCASAPRPLLPHRTIHTSSHVRHIGMRLQEAGLLQTLHSLLEIEYD
jgi:hypothetical protein